MSENADEEEKMEQQNISFKITRSRTGLPVVSEHGGGATNSGSSTIIAGENGEALKPLFVPRGSCGGDHALFVAKKGMWIIQASHGRNYEDVFCYQVKSIQKDDVLCKLVYVYENGDGDIPDWLQDAASAALKKSHAYHCRYACYIKE